MCDENTFLKINKDQKVLNAGEYNILILYSEFCEFIVLLFTKLISTLKMF